jgi:hypothetical protein
MPDNFFAMLHDAEYVETAEFRPLVTFQAPGQGDFGGVENLQTNEIAKLQDAEPPYLNKFKMKLNQKRLIPSNFVRILAICIGLQLEHCRRILAFSKANSVQSLIHISKQIPFNLMTMRRAINRSARLNFIIITFRF